MWRKKPPRGALTEALFIPLIIRALALREITLRDWWQVAAREILRRLALGAILGSDGAGRIMLWQVVGWYDYGEHDWLIALTVGLTLANTQLFAASRLAWSSREDTLPQAGGSLAGNDCAPISSISLSIIC